MMTWIRGVVVRLSFFFFPDSIQKIIYHYVNRMLSLRFQYRCGCHGDVSLSYPIYISGHKYIRYKHFVAAPGLRIECYESYGDDLFTPSLTMGDHVSFNYRCHIGVVGEVSIGDHVLIGSNVTIIDHNHGSTTISDSLEHPAQRKLVYKGPIVIENDVWICENVIVLGNVVIGNHSIVAANSVVTKDVPPYTVVAGNPARVINTVK